MAYGAYDDDAKKKKRYVVISISSVLLISMVVAVTIGVNNNSSENEHEITTSKKAIEELCAPTVYKKTCEETLMKDATNTTDPLDLVQTAFNVTMKRLTDVAMKSETMVELQKDPRTKMAVAQCKELADFAAGELMNSLEEMGKFDLEKVDDALIKLKVWLSAAISHEQTCLEGFKDTEGEAGETIKKALETSIELTHNGLAMITEMANYMSSINIQELASGGRRLLEYPSWVDGRVRRLLTDDPSSEEIKADLVVAQDGSGNFTTILEAMEEVPKKQNATFVVHIKSGLYKEYVQVNRSMSNLIFIGDGPDKTIISGDKNYKDNITTYRTCTVAIVGDNFIAKNMGFENTAGAIKHQAVAVRVMSDKSIFYNCRFDGYQDTLYTHSKRQFYRDCTISGTIDFLFGDAAAVFQNCTLLVRKPLENQACPITAHGRKDPRESTGYVFQGCTIAGEPDYLAVKDTSKAYLGRPWKEYSRTIIMNTFIPDFIQAEGWLPWQGDFGLATLFYSEVKNNGPGASLRYRVKWGGIKTMGETETLGFTPAQYIQGDTWIPGNGVPYTSGFFTGNCSESELKNQSSSDPNIIGSNAFSYSGSPSASPSVSPSTSASPSASPTASDSSSPSASPSASPTASDSTSPSASPTASDSASPSPSPTASDSASPSDSPSASPSSSDSASPSDSPSASASDSTSPSASPTASDSASPSASPSASDSASPSASPSTSPSDSDSVSPSASPSTSPSTSTSPTASPPGSSVEL